MIKKAFLRKTHCLWLIILLCSTATFAQKLTGKVSDDDGLPLIGANVEIKGTGNGTVTDENGMFTLATEGAAETLVISYVGFATQEILIGSQTDFDIKLLSDAGLLNEVVVVGYGTQKKKDLTGSIASADLEAFKEAPNVSILQSLKGALPGLTIGQTNRAGEEASINIRGTSTLNGNTSPLIIVDGLIFNGRLSDINPSDVQSVDVLKDPSSKAIYGSQAANGVVLVTTKTGKTTLKPSITYSGNYAISSPSTDAKLLDRDAYLRKVRDINYLKAYTQESGYTVENPSWTFAQSEFFPRVLAGVAENNNFDWYGAMTQQASIQNHNIGITAGNDKTKYFISGGYTKEKGLILNDDYGRYTARVNIDTEVAKWLTVGANTSGSFTNFFKDSPDLGSIIGTSPLVTPRDANGNFVVNPIGDFQVNPFLAAENDRKEVSSRLVGNFFGLIRVPGVSGLTYRLNFGNNLKYFKNYSASIYGAGQTGFAQKNDATSYDQTIDNILNYSKSFGVHNINATAVYGYQTSDFDRTVAQGTGFADLNLSYNSLQQAEIQKVTSEAWNEALLYQVGSLSYSYNGKYLLKTTVRRDGFSGFSKNNRTGVFPSVAVGWVISDENFLKNKSIEFLKLRAGYGDNGNKVGRYSSLARVSADDASKYVFGDVAQTAIGRSIATLANNDLKWERTRGYNVGLDFGFLKNRLSGNVEYYNSNTFDLLYEQVLPRTSGFSSVLTNIGQLNNKGIEFQLRGTPIETKDFSWEVTANFTQNRNKIVKLLGQDVNKDGIEDDLVASGLFIGKPIGTIYDYEVDGVYGLLDEKIVGFSAGTYRIVDQNKDGKITAADDRKILGNSEAAFLVGLQNTVSYKNFTLRAFVNSIQGGGSSYYSPNLPQGNFGTPGTASNSNWYDFYQPWSPRNPTAKYANPWVPSPVASSKRYFQRNFIRVQDVSLAYNLNEATTKKAGLTNCKVFVSGKNLFTSTKWDGLDPETGQGITANAFPVMKSYSFGLEITL
jgi:TonB-dependent starch-binding outer membrane protein SusC